MSESKKNDGGPMTLKGEGAVKYFRETAVRAECANCGEPAKYLFAYLLPNARRNPASSAYGRDDCSYCKDAEEFGCEECTEGRHPKMDGYERAARYEVCDRFKHLFLVTKREDITADYLAKATRHE